MVYTSRIKSNPVAPYNFDLSAGTFTDGDPQISRYEDGKFWQVIRVDKKLIFVLVESMGTVEEPEFSITLKSSERITEEDINSCKKIMNSMFNLDFDLKEFYDYMEADPVISKLIQELRGLKSRTTSTVFEALASSIIEQQISLAASKSIERQIIKNHGDQLHLDDEVYYAFPTPETFSKLTEDELRRSGLSLRKAEYIIDISKLIVGGKLDLERCKEYEDISKIVDELSKLRGVGGWTAHLTALRGMHRNQAFPADDLALIRSISHFYCDDEKISADDALKIASRWGKWKGLAAFYIIVGVSKDIVI